MRNWGEIDEKLETYLKSVEEVFGWFRSLRVDMNLGEDWLSLECVCVCVCFAVWFGLVWFVKPCLYLYRVL